MQTLARWIGRVALSLALLMAVLVWTSSASAYPWMIRKGYTTCNVCHADPSGGGLLTTYGRALGVAELTMKYKSGDDDPGKVSRVIGLYRDAIAGRREVRGLWRDLKATSKYGVTRGPLAIL